jgi:hypothetical protein
MGTITRLRILGLEGTSGTFLALSPALHELLRTTRAAKSQKGHVSVRCGLILFMRAKIEHFACTARKIAAPCHDFKQLARGKRRLTDTILSAAMIPFHVSRPREQ